MANFCSKRESVLQSLQNCSNLARQLIALRPAPSRGSVGFSVRQEQRAGAAAVPGTDVPCASCALALEKGATSEQRAAPRQLLPAGNSSAFHTLTLLLMPSPSPSQNKWPAVGQRIPSGTVMSGKEGLDWPLWNLCGADLFELGAIRQICGSGMAPLAFRSPWAVPR